MSLWSSWQLVAGLRLKDETTLNKRQKGGEGEVKENDCNCVGRVASTRQINELEWELGTRRTVGFPLLLLQGRQIFYFTFFIYFTLIFILIFHAPVGPLLLLREAKDGGRMTVCWYCIGSGQEVSVSP